VAGWRDRVSFVLVEPQEPGNVGAAARALKNMGFGGLRLVRPAPFTGEERWFAHLAEDVLEGAERYGSLEEAIGDCSFVVGTTRRAGRLRGVFRNFPEGLRELKGHARRNRVAVLFGREKTGLTNEETALCSILVTIPTRGEQPSLNLAHAVMVVAYELSRRKEPQPPEAGGQRSESALPATRVLVPHDELESFYRRLERALALLAYKPKGNRDQAKTTLALLRQLTGRAGLTRQELKALHGLCGQIEEKLG
jgi:tRNA/rRNA methyltransferase